MKPSNIKGLITLILTPFFKKKSGILLCWCSIIEGWAMGQLINIFTKALLWMQRNYAVNSVTNTIDVVLERGAQKLYDKYLNRKLPQHSHEQNNSMFENNLNLHEVITPSRDKIESVPLVLVQRVPKDTRTPNKVPVRKLFNEYSTLSPKNTTFAKSTKYQTILQSQKSNVDQEKNPENDSMFLEEHFENAPMERNTERPMTMQIGRNNRREVDLGLESKLEEVEEKRAATCHVRKRKAVSNREKDRLVKIKEEMPIYLREQLESTNRLRKGKLQKQQEQVQKESENSKINAYIRMKEKRVQQTFQDLKNKMKGKNIVAPVTNFESSNGEIIINGKQKQQQKPHIIQLQFNPEEERTLKSPEPKIMGVSSKKKQSFVSKLKNKIKITNQEYTNNGSRQTSSIPFMTLNYGIALSESVLEATAARRRPADEISREQFTSENFTNRFKSHIPIVNSARLNIFATISDHSKQTARSSIYEVHNSTQKRDYETTLESKREMEGSILWRRRGKSQNKKIRVSNQAALYAEILDSKLVQGNN